MSKVLTFYRTFPSYHPRKGDPTYFVEKLTKSFQSLGYDRIDMPDSLDFDLGMYYLSDPKSHTIRAGHRFKSGDLFSPRVWSGKPYNSKQIIIAPDIQVKKVWDFELVYDEDVEQIDIRLNDVWMCHIAADAANEYAKNDGLSLSDFDDWFTRSPSFKKNGYRFDGQIICWNENINY